MIGHVEAGLGAGEDEVELRGCEFGDVGLDEAVVASFVEAVPHLHVFGFGVFEDFVEVLGGFDFGLGEQLEDGGFDGPVPGGGVDAGGAEDPDGDAGKLVGGGSGVVLEVLEDADVAVEDGDGVAHVGDVAMVAEDVGFALGAEALAGLFDFVMVLDHDHELFEAERDDEADDDGRDMDQEVAPGVDGMFRRMNVHAVRPRLLVDSRSIAVAAGPRG